MKERTNDFDQVSNKLGVRVGTVLKTGEKKQQNLRGDVFYVCVMAAVIKTVVH